MWRQGARFGSGTNGTALWHLSRGGIPAIDVPRIATLEAATAVGAEGSLGSLESGKLADIVLLDDNPLEDIRNALSIWRVMLAGRVFGIDSTLTER